MANLLRTFAQTAVLMAAGATSPALAQGAPAEGLATAKQGCEALVQKWQDIKQPTHEISACAPVKENGTTVGYSTTYTFNKQGNSGPLATAIGIRPAAVGKDAGQNYTAATHGESHNEPDKNKQGVTTGVRVVFRSPRAMGGAF